MKKVKLITAAAILLVVYLLMLIASCGDAEVNLGTNPKTGEAKQEVLIYERLGLVDSVVSVEGVSENTHVLTLGDLDYSGAATLRVKFKYYTSYTPYLWSNNVNIYSGINNIYLSGGLPDTGAYVPVDHTVRLGEFSPGITKLRTTVYYGCKVLSVRDLQIYK